MYNCGDIMYNKETGNLIMIIGYNADDINEILRANKYSNVKIDTIEKLDNTYVSYYVLPLLVLTAINVAIDMKEVCAVIAKNIKSQALNSKCILRYYQEPLTHYEKIMHIKGMRNYLLKNKLQGVILPEYYTKKDLEEKFQQV